MADIGFPQEAYEQIEEQVKTATLEDFNFIPPRPNYSNKGTYGKILIIAGSKDISVRRFFVLKRHLELGQD